MCCINLKLYWPRTCQEGIHLQIKYSSPLPGPPLSLPKSTTLGLTTPLHCSHLGTSSLVSGLKISLFNHLKEDSKMPVIGH